MRKALSKLSVFFCILAIALSAVSGLSIRHAQAVPGVTSAETRSLSQAISTVDLSRYVRVGRFDLPEPTRTTPPPNNLLGQEASGVTYNWETNTLFITGDGGTSVTQVTKTGQLVDTMTLAPGSSPQGTDFYDPEGITYIGGGKFVLVEERDRQANLFTYVAGGILRKADVQTVKLGTTVGNVGLEGLSYDPLTNGFIFVKEADPISIFQTDIDFVAKTATNGSPTATGSTDLFNPSLANLADFSDVFALSNLPSLSGTPDYSHLLILSQESGQIINIDRSGTVFSRLTIVADPGNPLSVPAQTHEGLTMDRDGNLYVVSENGGGDSDHPQLWVYAPSTVSNQAPTAVTLSNAVTSIPENTSTAAPVKLADITVTDDGIGTNQLTVTGVDANSFQIIGTALYLKAGTALSSIAKSGYSITVNVDDATVGNTPDATTNFTLTVTPATGGTASLIISEVAPWSSGNSDASLRVDWFEVTNIGTATANIAGWKVDDDSRSFNTAVALNGVTNIAPGESVIFLETADLPGKSAAFKTLWFGANPRANLQIGNYSGAGIGLSTAGDQVNLFDSAGAVQAGVTFGASPAGPLFPTFDNGAGLNNATISTLSVVGVNGAFAAANDIAEIGSPGSIGVSSTPIVTITATDANAAETGNDTGTFRISRTGSTLGPLTVSYTIATGAGQATSADYTPTLMGAATIPAGQSFVEITITPVNDTLVEGNEMVTLILGDTGSYDVGANGTATVTIADSPILGTAKLIISEVAPWSSGNSAASLRVDWFEVSNIGTAPANIAGWKVDDDSRSFNTAVALSGVTNIAPGESVIFLETTDLPGKSAAFKTLWFGANPPANLQIGSYSGAGIGLSTGGDQVNLFDSAGAVQTGVVFGASPAGPLFPTFDNGAGLNNATISTLSAVGVRGGFAAVNDAAEIGSPGTSSPLLNQTISFAQLPNKTFGEAPFTLSATASSGLAVSFAAGGNCTVSGATVTLTGAGTCTLIASQAGDANFNPAQNVSQTFSIAKAGTTTAIIADTPDPSVVGQPVTVAYRVAANASGIGTPTGNVTVTDGVDSCTGTVATGSCVLTFSTAGARTLRATYAGDANFNGSSSPDEPHQVRFPIQIDQVYPGSVSPGERITLTVIGSGFVPQSRINIEGLGLTILTRYVASTKLTATVIIAANAFRSARDVTVTNPDGSSDTEVKAFIVR